MLERKYSNFGALNEYSSIKISRSVLDLSQHFLLAFIVIIGEPKYVSTAPDCPFTSARSG
jgi:hypothetical protein